MEKKILPPLLPGLEPGTQTCDLRITSLALYHWASHSPLTAPSSNIFLNQLNQNRLYSTHTKPLQGAKDNCCTNLPSTKQSFDIVWIHLQNLIARIFCLEEHSTVARVSVHAHVRGSVCACTWCSSHVYLYVCLCTCIDLCVCVCVYVGARVHVSVCMQQWWITIKTVPFTHKIQFLRLHTSCIALRQADHWEIQ